VCSALSTFALQHIKTEEKEAKDKGQQGEVGRKPKTERKAAQMVGVLPGRWGMEACVEA
jgi:hypothetical protein